MEILRSDNMPCSYGSVLSEADSRPFSALVQHLKVFEAPLLRCEDEAISRFSRQLLQLSGR